MKRSIFMYGATIVLLLFSVVVCAEEKKQAEPDISGEWSGTKQEFTYMQLTKKEGHITGVICERKDFDCKPIQNPVFKDKKLTFSITAHTAHRDLKMEMALLFSAVPRTLAGKAVLKPGDDEVPFTFRERKDTSKDTCKEIRRKHLSWFKNGQRRFRSMGIKKLEELGVIDIVEQTTKLTSQSTTKNMYDVGYLWMCAGRKHASNKKSPLPKEWTYSNMGKYAYLLGYAMNPTEKKQFTELVKAFHQGYIQAQIDRGL